MRRHCRRHSTKMTQLMLRLLSTSVSFKYQMGQRRLWSRTTGEAPNLSGEEHRKLLRIATGVSRGRVPIIAGAGSNSTQHAIELTKDAEASGADAILSVVPYYNRPTQAGLYAHFSEIAASGLPIILYDVPTRTACSLADESVARLAELPQIAGLKDATGDPSRAARLRMLVGTDFRLLSGDDATALAFVAQGGDGCISVTSNVAPGHCRDMFLTLRQGQITRAQRLSHPIAQLTAALVRETNPAPVKFALSLFGLMAPRVRLRLLRLVKKPKENWQELSPGCAMTGPRRWSGESISLLELGATRHSLSYWGLPGHDSLGDKQGDHSSSGSTKWLNFRSIGERRSAPNKRVAAGNSPFRCHT
jgi:4-hydroxy-tetrahydrodipicolinate synthase